MGLMFWAFLWGFAEATLFFIIPDVYLTAIALHDLKKGIRACFYALLGALLGGTLMYGWGLYSFDTALTVVENVPAINEEMLEEVKAGLMEQGLLDMALGPSKGIPYKIYAVQSAGLGISFLAFFLVSIPARLVRFLLTAVATWAIGKYVFRNLSLKGKYIIFAVSWIVIYIVYFWYHPS